MPPRSETRSGVGVPAVDQNVDAGVGQHDGLPPPPPNPPVPPIPPMGRGSGLPLECLCSLGGVEFRGLEPREAEEWLASFWRVLVGD
ncbi:hypothetical protein V6N13_028990 [Hibiscus sabdariffa]